MFSSIAVNLTGTNVDSHFLGVPYDVRVVSIYFTADNAISKHAVNYMKLAIQDASGNEIGSVTNQDVAAGVALVEGTPAAITVDGQYADVASGYALKFVKTVAGSGSDCVGTITVQLAAARG